MQGPLSRFGDTAANTGCIALLEDVDMPSGLKTVCASASAAVFRIFLMPVDALKTIMQASFMHPLVTISAHTYTLAHSHTHMQDALTHTHAGRTHTHIRTLF